MASTAGLVAGGPEAWGEAICELLPRIVRFAAGLAEGGQAAAAKLGDPDRVSRFWTTLLSL